MQSLLETCVDVVFPRACRHCGARTHGEQRYLCWDCVAAASFVAAPFCQQCGDPALVPMEHEYRCPFCTRQNPQFSRARSSVRYRGPVKDSLLAFKYGGGAHLCHDLACLLYGCIEAHFDSRRFDLILAVPMHPRRQKQRGYNQAQLLADAVSRYLKIPTDRHAIRRTRDTGTQTNLNARQRLANVRGAFAVTRPDRIDGRRILLCDDVMTTGATAAEIGAALMGAGAIDVQVASVARG